MLNTDDVEREEVTAANTEFYRAFGAGDFSAMDALWAHKSDVVCIHPGWPPVSGRANVMASWIGILSNPPEPAVQNAEECIYLMGEAAMVVCFETIGEMILTATNLFVREERVWRMVHHHAGVTEHRPRSAIQIPSGSLH